LIAALRAAGTKLDARAGKKEGLGGRNFCPPSLSAAAEFRANKVGAPQKDIGLVKLYLYGIIKATFNLNLWKIYLKIQNKIYMIHH
jgi:hypothetical protein